MLNSLQTLLKDNKKQADKGLVKNDVSRIYNLQNIDDISILATDLERLKKDKRYDFLLKDVNINFSQDTKNFCTDLMVHLNKEIRTTLNLNSQLIGKTDNEKINILKNLFPSQNEFVLNTFPNIKFNIMKAKQISKSDDDSKINYILENATNSYILARSDNMKKFEKLLHLKEQFPNFVERITDEINTDIKQLTEKYVENFNKHTDHVREEFQKLDKKSRDVICSNLSIDNDLNTDVLYDKLKEYIEDHRYKAIDNIKQQLLTVSRTGSFGYSRSRLYYYASR